MTHPKLNLARRLGLALVLLPWSLASQAANPALEPAVQRAVAPVPVGNTASTLPEGWHKGAFAEIFVRGYRDSNGDGIGDLRGLTQSLDYLKALGVRGIWLMPISPSQDRDHGYSVSDYRDIEPAYGTLADFDELLRQAHARGLGVIIDYVINHSAADNPVFLESARSPGSPLRNWYMWKSPGPAGWSIYDRNPWEATPNGSYLAQFNKNMPDFNLLEPAVVAFHKDNLRFWLNRGVDGFRFDAVPHLVEHGPDAWYDQPEDHGLMDQFRAVVDGYSHRYVVCEATGNMHKYAASDVCGSAFAIWRAGDIVGAARGEVKHIRRVADYFLGAPQQMATMISNHDSFAGDRLWDQLKGDVARQRLAAAGYLLQPGTPFIFYGEEIGMAAAAELKHDPKLRIPMSWTAEPKTAGFSTATPFRPVSANASTQNVAAEQARSDGILAWYRALLALRNSYPSLSRGSYDAPSVQGKAIAFRRHFNGETALVLINYGDKPARFKLRGIGVKPWKPVFPKTDGTSWTADAKGRHGLELPAQSVQVWIESASRP
ncbi:MAG: hypothetical protein A3E01_10635 [Gammaproteobacteria bacterium RIFCSPHIGHO2_12_FULL_63_22]|nr:MAG: hypothetical protein A3E01_10635 [Gammaproteobacteria bacterium RIFCSPHIGHO2_12_FULL_63_22]